MMYNKEILHADYRLTFEIFDVWDALLFCDANDIKPVNTETGLNNIIRELAREVIKSGKSIDTCILNYRRFIK